MSKRLAIAGTASDPAPALWDRKPAPWFLPLGERAMLRLSSSEEVDMEASMSFRKAVAQAYCLHKHIVNEHNIMSSMSAERSSCSQLSREKKADCAFPAAIRCAPAGHAPRSVSVPVISRFWSRCC